MNESDAEGRRYAGAGVEPCIDEVLADPMVHAVMRRDSVSIAEVRGIIRFARHAIRRRDQGWNQTPDAVFEMTERPSLRAAG